MNAPTGSQGFDAWLALPAGSIAQVVRALGLTKVAPASVTRGLEACRRHEDRCFVVLVDGWTLVFRAGVDTEDEVVLRLSQELGAAFAFHIDPQHDAYGWARAVGGRFVRVLARYGDALTQDGDRDGVEPETLVTASAEDVLQVADAWSISPARLLEPASDPEGAAGPYRSAKPGDLGGDGVLGIWERTHTPVVLTPSELRRRRALFMALVR